jgi:hypothetical protein
MLQGINTSGRYIQVSGGTSSSHVSKNYNSNGYMTGDMRYDLDSQCMKVFDGSSWQTLTSSYATIELTYEAESLLNWARQKRDEERLLEKQAQEHPTIKNLVDQIKDKQEQIKMVQTLLNSPGNEAGLSVPMQAP